MLLHNQEITEEVQKRKSKVLKEKKKKEDNQNTMTPNQWDVAKAALKMNRILLQETKEVSNNLILN